MLYLVCTCGEILGNKEIVYEDGLKQICEDLSVDFDMISQGFGDKDNEFKERRCKLVNSLCRRICCKELLITYVDVVQLIKG